MDEAQKTQKRQEAAEHLKKAEKYLHKTFFRPVLSYEAAPHFELAGDAYRAVGDWDLAKKAFYKAADSYEADGFFLSGVQPAEKAAKVLIQQLHQKGVSDVDKTMLVVEAVRAYEVASGFNMRMNMANTAAEDLALAAALCETIGMSKEPKELYKRACDLVDYADPLCQPIKVFHLTLEFLVKLQLYTEARAIVKRQIEFFKQSGLSYATAMCYVNELVLLLAMNDLAAAEETYTLQRQDEKFLESEEIALAEGLIQAYKSHDDELLKTTIRKKEFDHLDCKQIARLARKLTLFAVVEAIAP